MLATAGPTSMLLQPNLLIPSSLSRLIYQTSVQDTVDQVIADTMDILIDNTMSKLENATIYDNSDTSSVKFEPKTPSSIDISQSSKK